MSRHTKWLQFEARPDALYARKLAQAAVKNITE